MIRVKNLQTGKIYSFDEKGYERHIKGKQNWEVIPEKPVQKIKNTLVIESPIEEEIGEKKQRRRRKKTEE